MHPYRTPPVSTPDVTPSSVSFEDYVLAALLIAIGVARVAIAIARAETWTADVTLPALLGAVGVFLLTSRSADRARRRGSAAG